MLYNVPAPARRPPPACNYKPARSRTQALEVWGGGRDWGGGRETFWRRGEHPHVSLSPTPNPSPFPSKTFVNGAGGGNGGLAARALLEVPRSRPPVPGISPDCAGWLWRLLGHPSASEFQPCSGIILICVGRPPASGISDASLFLGLPDVASCIRQQLVGVVPKDEWGRFSEPGISPDCAGWLRRLSGRSSASEFQPRRGIILICVGRSPASGISDASLFFGLPDGASCIRQQLVGVVPKGEWGRFSEPGISPDCAGWLWWLLGRPSASEFQPRSGIILICVGRSLHLEYSDASLFLGLPDVASCIRQQFVGVVSKGEWGRFFEPGISPDCAG